MRISVVIPMYNVKNTILTCLKNLSEQEELPYEVILVDNNSTDDTLEVLKREMLQVNNLKIILTQESKRGPAAARNKGIRVAKGDIVAFTDADCIVRKDWIKNINKAFQDDVVLEAIGGVEIYTGVNINIVGKFLAAYWLAVPQKLNKTIISRKEDFLQDKFISTFNCAFRRKTLLGLKYFDESFYPTGEDIDIWMRALEKGAKIIVWDSSIAVCHPQNISLKGMIKKAFIYGEALSHLARSHFRGKIIFQIPYIGLKEFTAGLFTMLICANIFKVIFFITILAACSLTTVNATPILIVLFFLYLAIHNKHLLENKGIKISLTENIAMIFLFFIRELVEEAGRIYGSLKHRVICL